MGPDETDDLTLLKRMHRTPFESLAFVSNAVKTFTKNGCALGAKGVRLKESKRTAEILAAGSPPEQDILPWLVKDRCRCDFAVQSALARYCGSNGLEFGYGGK